MTESHPEITLADVTWLTALARSLVQDGSAADDLVQQTWVAAAESPPRGSEINRPWLGRVLKNLHLKSLRSGRRRTRREQVASKPEAAPSTAELIERAELRRTLADCLLALDEPYRGTLLLVAFEGYSTAQISQREGVPVGVVRHRLRKARELYKKQLEREHGGDWSKWYAALLPYASLPLPSDAAATSAATAKAGMAPIKATVVLGGALVVVKSIILTFVVTAAIVLVWQLATPQEPEAPRNLPVASGSSEPVAGSPTIVAEPVAATPERLPVDAPDTARPTVTTPPPETGVATLEVHVLSRSAGWIVSFLGDQPPFLDEEGPSWFDDGFEGGYESVHEGRGQFGGNPNGVYRFTSIRAGIPFTVAARDDYFKVVAQAEVEPLQAGEIRVVNLRVDAFQRDFTGRVVTDTGEPLAGAQVQISLPGEPSSMGNNTDSEGRFTLPGIGMDELVVCVRADGWARFVDTQYRIPDRGEVEIVMERGRTVRVDVRDSSGRPMADAGVMATLPNANISKFGYGYTNREGRSTLKTIPTRAVPLEVRVSGRVFRDSLPYGITDHVVTVPGWQTCRVRISDENGRGIPSTGRVGLRPTVPYGWSNTEAQWLDLNSDEVVFQKVFPGTYEAFLERSEEGSDRWESDPVEVEVTETTPGDVVLRI